jgi:tripartite-type tricarboxylate transporter receptor subunit TctC
MTRSLGHLTRILLALLLGVGGAAGAVEAYPSRTVRLVVPYPPGGATDALARLVMPEVSKGLGVTIVIDNRSGAGGTVGTGMVAKAAPDGYTLLLVFDTHAINPIAYRDLPYDSFKELTGITLMVTSPMYLLVPASSPIRDVKQLVQLGKEKPGSLNFGSTGPGSSNHLSA